jgi:hypothetical protein
LVNSEDSLQHGIVLSLCDRTGNMVKPWAEAGYECVCVDLKHPEGVTQEGRIRFVGADVRDWLPPKVNYKIVFAFPPCTDLAVSGARWFRLKGLARLAEAISVVESCRRICEWAQAPWMLENPVSTLSTYWREPDVTFNPCDFGAYQSTQGDAYTKRTCLWFGGGFQMPGPKPVLPVEGSKMHLLPPSECRSAIRAETPMGFAIAVFEANRKTRWIHQMELLPSLDFLELP